MGLTIENDLVLGEACATEKGQTPAPYLVYVSHVCSLPQILTALV
jgi:hypothetical protein